MRRARKRSKTTGSEYKKIGFPCNKGRSFKRAYPKENPSNKVKKGLLLNKFSIKRLNFLCDIPDIKFFLAG
jgi:hypothetical protein